MRPSGSHLLAEFEECSPDLLDDKQEICRILERGITESGFGLVGIYSHDYNPIGVTVVAIISESHVSIHTYPEAGHASVDIFTCTADPKKTLSLFGYLREVFSPVHVRLAEVKRGDLLEVEQPDRVYLASGDGIDVSMQVSEKLYSGHTAYQKVEVLRSAHFGKMLIIDNDLQIAECDTGLYGREMVAPFVRCAGFPGEVLILGGGDGCVAQELLKHGPKRITLVDIDGEVIDICRQYLPEICGDAFEDPRVDVVCEDAVSFLDDGGTYDAVVYDLTMHPEAFIKMPRSEYFADLFARIKGHLRSGGMLSMQCCSELDTQTLELIEEILEPGYTDIKFSRTYIPSFCRRWIFGSARSI